MTNKLFLKFIEKVIIVATFLMLLSNISYANTFTNNSISIDTSTIKRSYDYAENVDVNIKVENKNRYAKLYYKITEIYTGGGFSAINLPSGYKEVDSLNSDEIVVTMKDNYASDEIEHEIDTHITFNDGYYNSKGKNNVGRHAYGLTEKEYEEFTKYRNEKLDGKKLYVKGEKEERDSFEKEKIKQTINTTILIVAIIILLCIIILVGMYFVIKRRHGGGYTHMSMFILLSLVLSIMFSILSKNKIYASDTYQENVHYEKTVTTRCNYSYFECKFDVKIEYYFVNTIAPITDLSLDTDNDSLPDYLEVLYLTDLNNADTDSDSIPDGLEVYKTFTDPNREDTDNNGVFDGDEDYDKDGLTNSEEVSYDTDASLIDTDFDTITDYEEINGVKSKDNTYTYYTDPTLDDTDGDGLRDNIEIKLGLDPTRERTNGSTLDSERKISQEYTSLGRDLVEDAAIPISFYGEVKGYMEDNIEVKVSKDKYYDNLSGKIGNPIIINTSYGGSDGLKIKYDLTKYESIKERVQLCKIENGILTPVSNTYISGDCLLGDVTTGEYVLVDSKSIVEALKIYIK